MQRTRSYATIVYPESAYSDWLERLDNLKVGAVVSPLHDNDYETDTGEIKKPHYHVIFMFSSVKTHGQALECVTEIGSVGAIPVKDTKAMLRYLCHLDHFDKDKALYEPKDVITFGGIDYNELIKNDKDTNISISKMIELIEENEFKEFSQLVKFVATNNINDLSLLMKNAYFFNTYLRSIHFYDKVNS